jgi:integrase
VGSPYNVLIAVLGTCGLRWGEAVALRGRHEDELRRRLIVEESLAKISGRLVFGPTKSHSRRRVPGAGLPTYALTCRRPGRARVHRRQGRAASLSELPRKGVASDAEAPRVAKGWRPRPPALGRGPDRGRRGSPKTLQTVLGHRSAAFSLTVYAHLFDDDLDALADRFDGNERRAQ